MTKLFISYSRKDKAFAEKLVRWLADRQVDVWIDWEDIPPSMDWWDEIKRGIEEADVFIFLLSPDSVASKVCREEIGHALVNGRRLVPIVVRDVQPPDAPAEVAKLNWIFFRERDDFEGAFQRLYQAIHTDFEWVKFHGEIQVRALKWERRAFEKSLLLRGRELGDAEKLFQPSAGKDPQPTDLQLRFIHESREWVRRQRRSALIGLISLAVFIAGYYIWQDRTWFRVWPISKACPGVTVAVVEVSPGGSGDGRTFSDELSRIKSETSLRRCRSDDSEKRGVVRVDLLPQPSKNKTSLEITLPSTPAYQMDFFPEIRHLGPDEYTPEDAVRLVRASTAYSVGDYDAAIRELEGTTSLAGKILLAQAYLYANELESSRNIYRGMLESKELRDVNPAQLRMGLAWTLWYSQVSDKIRSDPDLYDRNVADCEASSAEYAEALRYNDLDPDWALISDIGKFYCFQRGNLTAKAFVTGNPYQDLLSALLLIDSGDVDAQSDLIIDLLESSNSRLSIANLESSKFYIDRGDCDNYRVHLDAFKASAFHEIDRSTVQYYYYDEKDCWPVVWNKP